MKILVIDDSGFTRAKLVRLFKNAGHDVFDGESGKTGLETYRKVKPDVVTVDLLMPEMSGIEFIKKLTSEYPDAAVAVISADIQESTRDEVISAGAAVFISKTSHEPEILKAVEGIATKSHSEVFTMLKRDIFSEMINISMGRAACALSSLIERKVMLRVPMFEILNYQEFTMFLENHVNGLCVMVKQSFSGYINGASCLLVAQDNAVTLINELISEEAVIDRLSLAEQTILSEVGNIVLNAAISVLGDIMKTRLKITLPVVFINESNDKIAEFITLDLNGVDQIIILASNLAIAKSELEAYLIFAMPAESSIALLRRLGE